MPKNKEIVANDNSAGLILDFMSSKSFGQRELGIFGREANFSTRKALEVVRQDPVVKGSMITIVDKILNSGWRVEGKDSRSRAKEAKEKLKELRFNKFLKKILFNAVMYNNAFGENIKRGKKVTDLNLLETNLTKIDADDNGDVNGYFQEVGAGSEDRITWKTSEVTHFKLDEMTTNLWADLNIQALYETVLIKDYIRQWLSWMFGTNQLRPVINVKGASEQKVKDFISFYKASEKNLKKPFIVDGEFVITKLQTFADEGKSVLEVIRWCNEEILILLQVPAISLGISNSSGRSDGVEMKEGLAIRIKSIQESIADDITYDLFPKMGFNKLTFQFGSMDGGIRTEVFEQVQLMRTAQFTPEAIEEYLEKQGVFFDTDKVLKTDEEIAAMSNKDLGTGNEGIKGNVSADAAQSRQRQPKGSLNKANKKEMIANSLDKLNKYPYTYTVRE